MNIMADQGIPAWAVKGAKVLIEPGHYARNRKFIPATITRVTKASVFATADGGTREQRFVQTKWGNDANRLVEYGNSGNSWTHDTYLWDVECDAVQRAQEKIRRQEHKDNLAEACDALARHLRTGSDHETVATQVNILRARLTEYEVSNLASDQ